MSGSTGLIDAPTVPQPTAQGDIVGLNLQNTGTTATPAQPLTFGEVFKAGAVMPGQQLVMEIGGQSLPVQIDPKTYNADGSVAMAVVTVMAPSIAANNTEGAMLALAPASTPAQGAAVNLESALNNYSLLIDLSGTDSGGQSGSAQINAVAAMQKALQNGTATYWQQGPLATQASVQIPVEGSSYLTVNITAYANGTFSSDIQFDNDIAMGKTGGTVTYSEKTIQDGTVVAQQSNITQYQYQDWNQVVGNSGPSSQINIQHDMNYLEQTGAIANYDLTAGVGSAVLSSEESIMDTAGYGEPLAANGVTQDMPEVGGRPDIGPTTGWNAAYVITQNATMAEFSDNQADASGSVPWNFIDASTGQALTTADVSNIWTNPGDPNGTTVLTQPVSADTGWTSDVAHQPDLSYIPYLLTGNEYYLDQLNNQAAWSETALWPATEARNNGQGLVAPGEQVRAAAWDLRAITEAALVNPQGSSMQQYFQQMEDNNFSYLVSMIPTWTAQEGQAYGYLPGVYGSNGSMAPWEQDYLASSVVFAAENGNADAKTFLGWESNFLVGRFLNGSNGFDPHDGIAYNLYVSNPTTGQDYTTWAGIEQATEAAGQSNGTGWATSDGDYGMLAAQSLAGIITVTESPQAIEAYGWLLGSGAPYVNAAAFSTSPQFDIVPRLSDGNLLTGSNIIISQDTTATTITGSNNDQLIEAGSGNDTVLGGTGINILFGGSGNDLLVGGANNDYLYGGTGSDTLVGGAGTNYLQSGSGPTTFVFSSSDSANNTVDGFRPGTDQLDITGSSGSLLSAADLQAILSGATTDSSGDAVLALSATNTLTLSGVSLSQLSASIFGTALPSGIPSPAGAGSAADPSSSTAATTTLSASANDPVAGGGSSTAPDPTGSSTVAGGAGSNQTAADTVAAGGNDTISANAAPSVSAASTSPQFITGDGTSTVSGGAGSNAGGSSTVSAGTANTTLMGGSSALALLDSAASHDPNGSGSVTIQEASGSVHFSFDGADVAKAATFIDSAAGKGLINYQDLSGNWAASSTSAGSTEVLSLTNGLNISVNFSTS